MAFSLRSAWTFRSSVAVVLAALGLATAPTVTAHIEGLYGNRGYVWLQFWYNGTIWATSNNCNPRETSAFDRVLDSTAGKAEFANRWSDGLVLIQKTCDGVVGSQIDIKLVYSDFADTHPPGSSGLWGENHSTKASASWCDLWNKPYPCGSHPSTVHINLPQWNNGRTQAWKEKLIMHETGHALGIAHHCADDSIMNTPAANDPPHCTNSNWEAVLSWKAHDRNAHVSVYPNWQGP